MKMKMAMESGLLINNSLPFILLDDRKSSDELNNRLLFAHGIEDIVCNNPDDLLNSLARIDELKQQGHYLAGFISYEAGFYLDTPYITKVKPVDDAFPLLHFTAFKQCLRLTAADVEAFLLELTYNNKTPCQIDNLRLNMSKADYLQAFDKVKQFIHNGHTYQVNLTAKYLFDFSGSPIQLYQQLRERQKVPYASLLMFEHYKIVSLSPELFFCKTADRLVVKPMKGTMPRATDCKQDEKNKSFLTTDVKSIAENTMIVDLLRNDLSSISHTGTVKVVELLNVESYETLHQMTSTIESRIDSNLSFKHIVRRLFPCGSITGAPKRRTMEIIDSLETAPRHVYTGAIGYITPINDMCFSVPIRTLLLRNNSGELGVGGGIVYDSDGNSEFEELKLKAQFFTKMPGVVGPATETQ